MRPYFLILVASAGTLAACIKRLDFHCEQDSNCDQSGGGVCTTAGTGNRWCAYPDLNCPAGYRYSNQEVGDGVSGSCVTAVEIDAGVDGQIPDTGGPPATSCLAVPYTCGASSNDNCCNSPKVTGGAYYRSNDSANDVNSGDRSAPAMVSSFRLDKYEVTVGRFRAFVTQGLGTQANHPAVGAGTHANIPGSGWEASWNTNLAADTPALVAAIKCNSSLQTWTDAPGPSENRPMNCINWYEAMAFCAWDGGYLPTEAEWNYAATGGAEQRAYPWSSPASSLVLDSSRASYNDGTGCIGDGMPACTLPDLLEVGSKPAGDGRWGQSDLAGNVWEWVLDWPTSYVVPCTDCANLIQPSYIPLTRAVRGGDFEVDGSGLRTGYRSAFEQSRRTYSHGVRCARAP